MGRVKVWTDMLPSHEFGKTQHCVAGWNLLISFFFFLPFLLSLLHDYTCSRTRLLPNRNPPGSRWARLIDHARTTLDVESRSLITIFSFSSWLWSFSLRPLTLLPRIFTITFNTISLVFLMEGEKTRRRREEENWGYLWLHLAVGKRANVTFHLPARAVSLILFIETLWPIDDVICLLEPDWFR